MNRIVIVVVILFTAAAGLSPAGELYKPVRISIQPEIDIPLAPDSNLFKLSGGCGISGNYIFPFFKPLSAGVAVNYHLGRMDHADLVILGTLSIMSTEGVVQLRGTLLRLVELYISGGFGYYYALLNEDLASSVSNLMFSGGAGIGFRVSSRLSIGLQGQYRRYNRLYHFIGAGLGIDLWLGGTGKKEKS